MTKAQAVPIRLRKAREAMNRGVHEMFGEPSTTQANAARPIPPR